MTCFADFTRATAGLLIAAALASAVGVRAQSPEEQARRLLESGREFLRKQNHTEALADFQRLLKTYGTTSVADDALLEVATYQLEVGGDARAADKTVDQLLQQYDQSDSAPMAQVLKGRVALALGSTREQADAAIASFDRVPRLYPGTDAVPAAMYFAGEAYRISGRREESIARFRELTTSYPTSPWTARGLLGSASSFVGVSQPLRALEQLQRERLQFGSSREAATALEWNTILYRLYVRAPSQPPYVYGAPVGDPKGRFRDVTDIAVDRENNLLVASKTGVSVLNAKGTPVRTIAVQDPLAIFLSASGRVLSIHEEGGLREEGKPAIVLSTTTSDGKLKPLKLEAGISLSNGDLLVADRDLKAMLRFSSDGKPKGEFARQMSVRRLAVSELDEIAALDTDAKTVTLLSRDGKVVTRIPERGTGYQLRQPIDVAFDRFGHVYVLDRGGVLVFSQQGPRLVATFAPPEKAPGAFGSPEALALDSAARLFVFDGRTDAVQVYR
jgi:TolA-binding protein